jgi:hypothetical protein
LPANSRLLSAGRLQQEQYGTLTPIYHKLHYNIRGQLYDVRLSTQPWQAGELDGDRGAITNYYSNQNFTPGYSGADNNGNLVRSETYIPGSDYFQQRYTYDSLSRLTRVDEYRNGQAASFAQAYLYDRYGNRSINQTSTWGTGINNIATTVDPATNRLSAVEASPVSYDNNGNLLNDGHTFVQTSVPVYDAENSLIRVDYFTIWRGRLVPSGAPSTQYIYNAEGRRVGRYRNGRVLQVYGMDGELLAEYQDGGILYPQTTEGTPATAFLPLKEYGFRNGQLLVTASSGDDKRIDRFITNFYFAALGREPSGTELSQQRTAFLQAGAQGQAQLFAAALDHQHRALPSVACVPNYKSGVCNEAIQCFAPARAVSNRVEQLDGDGAIARAR